MLPPLNDVLKYTNPLVIQRFQRNYPDYHDKAHDLFTNMLKYLWLCKKHDYDIAALPNEPALQFACTMHVEMHMIDEMWHTFILITKDYADFCHHYFNEFLHHIPNVNVTRPLTPEEFEGELNLFLSYIYDNLGEDTMKSWFGMDLETQQN